LDFPAPPALSRKRERGNGAPERGKAHGRGSGERKKDLNQLLEK
jgi:hypothetical protein